MITKTPIDFLPWERITTAHMIYGIGTAIKATQIRYDGTGTWPTANKAIYVPIYLPGDYFFNKFAVLMGTPNGNIDIGLYSKDTLTKIISTGPTLTAGTLTVQYISVPNTIIKAGSYYLALSANANANGALPAVMRATPPAPIRHIIATGTSMQLSSFPLPSTATLATPVDDYIPAIGMISV